MSLNDLTKEQKQYAVLGLLAASIVVILMVLGIRFSMTTITTAKEELDDLSGKINKSNRALSRSRQTSEDYVETLAVLADYLKNAPPERNYYSWATEVIYSTARVAGLEIDSIDEVPMPQRKRSRSNDPAAISFESYALRIIAHGGYENTKYFLNLLNRDYPLVRFSGVEISSGQSRDKHNIQLYIQWPFNFGEISKNWDALASKRMKVADSSDGEEAAMLKELEPEAKSTAAEAAITPPNPVSEPYPPTTRPEAKEIPAPAPMVEPIASEAQPVMGVTSRAAPSSEDTVPKPATDEEFVSVQPDAAPSETESIDDEPQPEITVSESVEEPVPEQGVIAAKPAAEPDVVFDPNSEPLPGQEELALINSVALSDTATVSEEPHVAESVEFEAMAFVGPQPLYDVDEPRNEASIDKSEKNSEEVLNLESAEADISMTSLLEDMMGEINE